MESQPKNPEFRNNPENFHPCVSIRAGGLNFGLSFHLYPYSVYICSEDWLACMHICYSSMQ